MKIGIASVDSKIPNLALMKISAYHKSGGDRIELFNPLFAPYDLVYASKVFTHTLVREIYKKIKISYVFAHTWKSSGRNLFFIADSQDILRIKLIYAMIKLAHPEISEMIPIIRIVKTDKMTNEMKDAYKRIKGAK